MRAPAFMRLGLCAGLALGGWAAAGCGGLEADPTNGSGQVAGSAWGSDFTFLPASVGARLAAHGVSAELVIDLCELGCPGEPDLSRAVRLTVRSSTAQLRTGQSFEVGGGVASAAVHASPSTGQPGVQQAVGGEVRLDSCDLRLGGLVVGTFQVLLASGEAVGGFFEAPLEDLAGPVVVLGPVCPGPP